MFERNAEFPMAVASDDDDGLNAAIDWCCEHMRDDDILTVWTHLRSNLRNSPQLEHFVASHRNVEHVAGKGGGFVRHTGPVLMAWPGMADIGELFRFGVHHIRALGVVVSNEDTIRPWVSEVKPTILGDSTPWEVQTPEIDGIVMEALKSLTRAMNHNNTISAGSEKDQVVSTLLALHDAGITMDDEAMEGWALAHGWSGKNPQQLGKYVRDINQGKRPQCRTNVRPDYVDFLRRRASCRD
ncbi:hypothetical protein [Sciscionella marina]|uniref:hypothetical protein n=1 Tax=Sciscionella marina TaxID=508770 RepID=UPI00035E69EE|nr:hypothetical protein [Sciscionella marina]